MIRFSFIVFFVFACGLVSAQTRTLKGKIYYDDRSPMIGVNVLIKGTTIGTTTDLEGTFQLEIPEGEVNIILSGLMFCFGQPEITIAEETDFLVYKDSPYKSGLRIRPRLFSGYNYEYKDPYFGGGISLLLPFNIAGRLGWFDRLSIGLDIFKFDYYSFTGNASFRQPIVTGYYGLSGEIGIGHEFYNEFGLDKDNYGTLGVSITRKSWTLGLSQSLSFSENRFNQTQVCLRHTLRLFSNTFRKNPYQFP